MVMNTLVIAPHMDDEVLGCGGYMQKNGNDTHVVFVTERQHDVRINDQGQYVEYSGEHRQHEMRAVAAALGYRHESLGFKTHGLFDDKLPVLIQRFEDVVRRLNPMVVLIPGPSHDNDHEMVRKAFASVMRPHCYAGSVFEYWTWGVPTPYEPVELWPLTHKEIDLKVAAMEMYRSQVAPGGTHDDLYPYSPESIYMHAAAAGRLCHREYAEAYTPRRLVAW